MQYGVLRCPDCHDPLDGLSDTIRCGTCDRSWPVRGDVPDFTTSVRRAEQAVFDAYSRMLPELVLAARRDGWLQALQQFVRPLPDIGSGLFAYVTDESKGDLVYTLDINPQGNVLDLGCGLGAVSVAVASRQASCWAVDISHEQAAFTAIRCDQMGFPQVRAVAAGDDMKLPFADGFFDAAIMNGVLEWLGCADRFGGAPEQAQVAMLREVWRVLKPAGQLYVASKNRFALQHFLGAPPDHGCKRRWLGMLDPRIQSCLTFGKVPDSGARIYGLGGYRRLFRAVGFEEQALYALMPDFRRPKRIIPLHCVSPTGFHGAGAHAIYTRRLEAYVAALIPSRFLKFLAYCYGFVLQKQ